MIKETTKKPFKMGPLQEAWVQYLEKHPEKQGKQQLGYKTTDGKKVRMCCLGAMCHVYYRSKKKRVPWTNEGVLCDTDTGKGSSHLLSNIWEKIGLNGPSGLLPDIRLQGYSTLTEANDMGVSWSEIAKFIRKNPKAVFSKPV